MFMMFLIIDKLLFCYLLSSQRHRKKAMAVGFGFHFCF